MIRRSVFFACRLALIAVAASLPSGAATAAELKLKPLKLINGWQPGGDGARAPAVAIDGDGVVHMVGAMSGGSEGIAFKLPQTYRPKSPVFIQVGMCFASSGRMLIQPNGVVTFQADDFETAKCFTTLEGVTYLR